MTTSSANNSVFRGFFEKQKLTGPNFIDWYRQLRILLSIEDQLNYLEQLIPPASVAHAGHNAWIKGSKEIAGLMLMTMEPDIQQNLDPLHAYEMLRELKILFAHQAEQELLQTTRDFHSCKQEEGQSVSSYVLKMKGYIDNLERLGHPVTLGLGVSMILICLRKEYDGFVQNYNMDSMGKIVNELHAMLKLHEQTLPKNNAPALHVIRAGKVQKGNKHKKSQSQIAARGQNHGKAKNKQAYAPKPKIPLPPKREDPAKDSICHACGETRHWNKNCPQYLAELLKKKKNAASGTGGSGIFVIKLNTILNRSWIYDTGCGTHICNTMQGLRASRKLKPRAFSLYVGNGQREAVNAIGVFNLCLPSRLEIVLSNCHYAPSITRGVISVSRLYEDGFINLFINNTIQVSRNNMVYFSDIPRDGIFEIDLSNSYTNESSVYAISNKRAKLDLDSALLWHYCLGHISKKRIEKLQHDGLLDSSDLRAFEKCVSCMSGKMARKPYTYQAERAKDLLGLIHTDPIPFAPVVLAGQHVTPEILTAHTAWIKGSKEIAGLMLMTMKPEIQQNLEALHAHEMLLELKTMFAQQVEHELLQTTRDFHSCKQEEGQSLSLHVLKMKGYFDNLERLGHPMKLGFGNSKRRSIPMQEKIKLSKLQGASTPAELKRMQNVPYASVVAFIMYAVRCTRPDVPFAQNATIRFQQNPVYELGVVSTIEEPISMYCDNTGAIAIANESGITKGARHFRAKVHYLHKVIEYGDVKLEKVHTDDNLADPFTKVLAFPKHSEHTRNIEMLPASSLM
nr:zinc finger, CCHC-type [Tanacetum cinerariifolium]